VPRPSSVTAEDVARWEEKWLLLPLVPHEQLEVYFALCWLADSIMVELGECDMRVVIRATNFACDLMFGKVGPVPGDVVADPWPRAVACKPTLVAKYHKGDFHAQAGKRNGG
jgi:hypothetical protein